MKSDGQISVRPFFAWKVCFWYTKCVPPPSFTSLRKVIQVSIRVVVAWPARLGDPEKPKLLEHGVLLHILLQAALELGVIAVDPVLIRELRRQQVHADVERILFLRIDDQVAALSHSSALGEPLSIASAMQLDQPIAHRRIDEEITHELHPAMLPQKKRAPGGARSSCGPSFLRSDGSC